ncbi:MAG: hypothetical protein LBD43_01480 [Holosporales bacterium]|nr:hypothetical protein [Holosporales bacterium]
MLYCISHGVVPAHELAQLETLQLPISVKVEDKFPTELVPHFIIINNNLSLVVHEHDPVLDQITLHDTCHTFNQSGTNETTEMCDTAMVHFFGTSQVGCVFSYKNKHGCEFTCAACWFASKSVAITVIRLILKWLDQFFISEVTYGGDESIEVPVFYGTQNVITVTLPQKQRLLLSERYPNEVRRIVLYRTAIGAPIYNGDTVGHVHYITTTFQNPLSRQLYAQQVIEKAGIWKTIVDSFKYAIFGPSANLN